MYENWILCLEDKTAKSAFYCIFVDKGIYFRSILSEVVGFFRYSQNPSTWLLLTWLLLNSINQVIMQRGERLYNILATLPLP